MIYRSMPIISNSLKIAKNSLSTACDSNLPSYILKTAPNLPTTTRSELLGQKIIKELGIVNSFYCMGKCLDASNLLEDFEQKKEIALLSKNGHIAGMALKILAKETALKGGNAIVGVGFSIKSGRQEREEVLCYGTAVVVESLEDKKTK